MSGRYNYWMSSGSPTVLLPGEGKNASSAIMVKDHPDIYCITINRDNDPYECIYLGTRSFEPIALCDVLRDNDISACMVGGGGVVALADPDAFQKSLALMAGQGGVISVINPVHLSRTLSVLGFGKEAIDKVTGYYMSQNRFQQQQTDRLPGL